ncbi:MAG: hypothetical protein ACYTAN_16120 [Planctomycetota bacterium]|jgi:hypothetical protein
MSVASKAVAIWLLLSLGYGELPGGFASGSSESADTELTPEVKIEAGPYIRRLQAEWRAMRISQAGEKKKYPPPTKPLEKALGELPPAGRNDVLNVLIADSEGMASDFREALTRAFVPVLLVAGDRKALVKMLSQAAALEQGLSRVLVQLAYYPTPDIGDPISIFQDVYSTTPHKKTRRNVVEAFKQAFGDLVKVSDDDDDFVRRCAEWYETNAKDIVVEPSAYEPSHLDMRFGPLFLSVTDVLRDLDSLSRGEERPFISLPSDSRDSVVSDLIRNYTADGVRDQLVLVLSHWCPSEIVTSRQPIIGETREAVTKLPVEFFLATSAPATLEAPITILAEAYQLAKFKEVKKTMATALRSAFQGLVQHREDDDEFVLACWRWYKDNSDRLSVNNAYSRRPLRAEKDGIPLFTVE